jgi:uncharacterized OB-fold protein
MSHKIVEEFRAGLCAGELLLQECDSCRRLNMYPRYACPYCQSEQLGWKRSNGRGSLHSFTVQRLGAPAGFEAELPFALGVVKLEEGPQLLARLWPSDDGGGWDGYACDAVVEFAPPSAEEIERRPIAWFRLA